MANNLPVLNGQVEKQPRTKVVTDQNTVTVSRIETDTFTRQDYVTQKQSHQVFTTRQVEKQVTGGWDKCMGPFDDSQAQWYGVDVWDCQANCYTRVDDNGSKYMYLITVCGYLLKVRELFHPGKWRTRYTPQASL